jgi:putrescine transport system substrate-binding protein
MSGRPVALAILCLAAASLGACSKPDSDAVSIYIWADYLAPDTFSAFEKATGIKVHAAYFDNSETQESSVLTGHSGFDVVVPTGAFFRRQIGSGAYLPLDKSKLPNLVNLNPAIMARMAQNDPGNVYGVVYTWGTFGIGYNEKMVAQRLSGDPPNSWRLLFDPAYAAKLAPCGINFIDDPVGVVHLVLKYLGRNPNAPSGQDFADVEKVLGSIRPFVRNIDTSGEIEAIANGDICISLGYNGDFVQARKRAADAGNGITLGYLIPLEGSLQWFDLLAIPRDAPHVANAYAFINYLMNPKVMAHISNAIGFASANAAATPLLDASIASDRVIYPTAEEQQRLFVSTDYSIEQTRLVTRLWQKFRTAQ